MIICATSCKSRRKNRKGQNRVADEAAISAYARPAVSWARAEKVVDGVGGNQITIYYAQNSWNFTRLGKVNDVTAQELKEILGNGNVSVTLSLEQP